MAALPFSPSSPMPSPCSSPVPPPRPMHLSPPHPHLLHDLLRERAAIDPIRMALPHLSALLDAEIARLRALAADASASSTLASLAYPALLRPPPLLNNSLVRRASAPSALSRKCVKLPVPADKYPEYNFVGRLLGPRGTTLKTLERDTGCKIMIRGKGSIRKDKEPEVRGKPGWEHVFNEPLHVVIELADPLDDSAATAALNRAKDQVERLLVPVPEERDGLKRQQLRALAIMNGTFRGGPTTSHEHLSIPPYASSPPTQNLSTFSVEPQSAHMYLGDTTSVPLHSPIVPRYDHPSEDNSFFRMVHYPSQPSFSFDQNRNNLSGRASPSSGATSPNTYDNSVNPLSVLTSKIQQCAIDEFGSSSVGDDSPDSSHTSDDGEPSTHIAPASYPDIQVKSSSISPSNRADTSLGVGGFIGQEFYNGAFSNGGASPNTWDQHPSSSTNETSTPFSSALYGLSPVPSPQVLTNSTSTVTPIDRHYGY